MHERSRLRRPVNVYKKGGLRSLKRVDWKTTCKKFVSKHKRKIFYLAILFITIIILIPPATYLYFAKDLKSKESVISRGKTGLTLEDRDGQSFYTFYQPKQINYIALSAIPKSAQEAVIATEDKNFYTNPGFSVRGIARAFVTNIFAGKIVEGGSTITQELAKNAFLSDSRNVLRKYQELVLASELNRRFSKQDILEMYLNEVYFGEGAFGIENASQAYFGIPAKELSLSQAALLIGILPAPSAYSPLSNPPDKAIIRQKIVLNEMVQDGYITHSQADAAAGEKLVYNTSHITTEENTNTLAFHFANYIRKQLISEYGEERIIRDGFTVKTTLNQAFQTYAEQVVKNQVLRLKANKASNGAAVAIDPKTGQILAMVGSYDWTDPNYGQTNMAITPRQPGSSFKPIIYSRALEDKLITPATMLQDVATTFDGGYKPLDYDKRFRGDVTVRRALSNSLNIPAVEVMQKVGVTDGLDQAKKLGISTLSSSTNYGLSLVLGTGEVPLLEMTNAYAVFADQGIYHAPTGILAINDKYGQKVGDSHNFLWYLNPLNWFTSDNGTAGQQVVSKETSFLVSSILSDSTARAEEFGSALTIARPAAVKTGTTEDFRDALTIGYTPSLVVGVWVGNNDNTTMDNIAGSLGAAPIWRNMMEDFLQGTPVEQFEKPTFVVSQLVCAPGKSTGYDEFFLAGTQPATCAFPTSSVPTVTNQPTYTPGPTQPAQPTNTPAPQPTEIPQPTVTTAPLAPTAIPLPTVRIP